VGGQGIERRDIIRMIGLISASGVLPGFQRWGFACGHEVPGGHVASSAVFQPQFFTQEEFQLVDRLADLIIPADDHLGAHDAGVAEFIDFMVFSGADLGHGQAGSVIGAHFHAGLAWINARSKTLYGHPFLECTPEQHAEFLDHLAYKDRFRAGEEEGQSFFRLMRNYTVKGYYSSRIGMEALGDPSLQTMWAEMPGCPHLDDPEHLHLPPPIV